MKNKVEGHPNLVKDTHTGVIDVMGNTERQRYRTAKKQALMNMDSQAEIARLTSEINELKSLVTQLINK